MEKKIKDLVKKIFKENELGYEYYVNDALQVEVHIYYGDWKHDHIALRNIMANNMFFVVDTFDYEEDESDSYSCGYVFEYADFSKETKQCMEEFKSLSNLNSIAEKEHDTIIGVIVSYLRDKCGVSNDMQKSINLAKNIITRLKLK